MDMTLSELLTSTLKRNKPRTAIIIGESEWTYGELDDASDALASGLARLGINPGDRIALYLKNSWEYVVVDFAIAKLGAVKVPLNEYQSENDVQYILDDTDAKIIVGHQSLLDNVSIQEMVNDSLLVVSVPDGQDDCTAEQAISWHSLNTAQPIDISHSTSSNDTAMITYTGGTTGAPKGVVQTQQSLAVNLFAHIIAAELAHDEVMLLTTPLPHSAGYHMQACLVAGGTVVLSSGFSPSSFFRVVSQHKVTWTFLVPTMIYRLLDFEHEYDFRNSSLRTVLYGAAPMSTARLEAALEMFGQVFVQLFGQTECPNYVTTLSKEDHHDKSLHSSCGRPVSLVKIKTDTADGNSSGEILVKAPYLLKEYYKNPEQTKAAIRDGWLHTGDIGYINEDGYLFLQDRAKDMIISGGLNVYSNEVEQVLKQHRAVKDAAVIGIPHPDWGEQVVAVVVARDTLEARALIDHCKQQLSKYKVPKSVIFRERLPLTPYNKIDKKLLRLECQEG